MSIQRYVKRESSLPKSVSCHMSVPPGFHRTFFWFLRPKITDIAVAFLKICSDICGISYCFAVKICHGQHSSNIVITFLTSRTIVGLQTNIWGHQCHKVLQKVAPAPDSKALTLIAHVHLGDVYVMSAFTYARCIFLGCLLICNTSLRRFLSDVK